MSDSAERAHLVDTIYSGLSSDPLTLAQIVYKVRKGIFWPSVSFSAVQACLTHLEREGHIQSTRTENGTTAWFIPNER